MVGATVARGRTAEKIAKAEAKVEMTAIAGRWRQAVIAVPMAEADVRMAQDTRC
jgi:hypothetical protein